MDWQKFLQNCHNALEANTSLGGDSDPLVIKPPATEQEINQVELALGMKIPDSLRKVLANHAKQFTLSWFLSDEVDLPDALQEIFCGNCYWSLETLAQHNIDKNKWLTDVFPNPNNSYDVVWHNKFAFQEVGNGDYLAIDLAIPNREPVVYLSHADGAGHGYELGENFQDFLTRWSVIGCTGAEDWQWLPFTQSSKSFIDPECPNAIAWKQLFGLM